MHPHPYSLIFPSMSREEYSQLSTDIAKNGLLEPITVYQGMVLDGRNRDIICHNLGITPKIVEFTGTDQQALDFVISKNLHRRHLSASQRAMVATSFLVHFEEIGKQAMCAGGGDKKSPENRRNGSGVAILPHPIPDNNKSRAKAAKAVGVAPSYVSDAKTIAIKSPAMAERVKTGEITIPKAKQLLQEERSDGEDDVNPGVEIIRRSVNRFDPERYWQRTTLVRIEQEIDRWPTKYRQLVIGYLKEWIESLQ